MSFYVYAGHLKLMFPMAWAITNMAWAMIDGRTMLETATYHDETNWDWAAQTLEYGAEFLLKCSFDNGEFVVQVCLQYKPRRTFTDCIATTCFYSQHPEVLTSCPTHGHTRERLDFLLRGLEVHHIARFLRQRHIETLITHCDD